VIHLKRGFLSQYFEKIAIKKLSSVETDRGRSNQHEFNGSASLKSFFGDNRLNDLPVSFIWLGVENEGLSEEGHVTWYDARERHPSRSEWRLYFKDNPVIDFAQSGDLMILARRPNLQTYIVIVKEDTTFERQLFWLFGIDSEIGYEFQLKSVDQGHDPKVDFAVRYILEELGIEVQEPDSVLIDTIIEPYIDKGFPTTREFSKLTRDSMDECDPVKQPDHTLIQWMNWEEKLFKRLERHIIKEKLEKGFNDNSNLDVDGFLEFSLSVQNRRKSRVGYALENHLQEIFNENNINHSRGKVTENKSRPDFLFPSIQFYHDLNFNENKLTMLGVKSTCKDRWRQVLSEARRIDTKHLLTLEPGISENQTHEMSANKLRLVLPRELHETYTTKQREWLIGLGDFISLLKERQG